MKTRSVPREEAEKIHAEITKLWPRQIMPKKLKGLLAVQVNDRVSLLMLDDFTAVNIDGKILPFLADSKTVEAFPYIVVDPGAVRFICGGANIMRPGVKAFPTPFNKGDIVVIKEERYLKAIAVGEACTSSIEAQALTKGVIVENLHYVGDKAWEAGKEKGRVYHH